MKFAVITFGCRVNQADSLEIESELLSNGGVLAPPEDADLVVVNTCSVTAAADQGARQTIRRLSRMQPDVRVVVTGCYATRQPAEVGALPNVVRVVPNERKDFLATSIRDLAGMTTAERFGDGDHACGATLTPGSGGRTALTLRVQTGCEEACSYCIIPSTRGRGRSRTLREVRERIQSACAAGYREIVITGVHLGSYGRDLDDGSSLTGLVRMLAAWPDAVLFRISSLEPMDCSEEMADLVAQSPRLAAHFHLPLQHTAEPVLRAMRRPYTAAYYERLVNGIHERMPHAAIGTDIIVGFPGETAADFDDLAVRLARLPLTHLHVFPYSDRPGTEASSLPDKVEGAAIRERSREVRAIGEAMARRFRAAQVGAIRPSLAVDDGWSVVTDNYLKVRLDRQRPRNTWVDVQIESAEPLTGRAYGQEA